MNVKITQETNGFILSYIEKDSESTYVYKATEDLLMLEELSKRLLKRKVKIEEK